jgi:hypothetical protein
MHKRAKLQSIMHQNLQYMEIEHLSKREVVPTKVPTASKEKEGGNRVNKPIQKAFFFVCLLVVGECAQTGPTSIRSRGNTYRTV